MSYFGNALKHILQKTGVTGSCIQASTDIKKSSISRWLHGKQVFIKPEDIAKINSALTNASATEKAELIAAHLQDELKECGPGSELVEITVRSKTAGYILHETSPPKFGTKLSASDQKTFARLAAKIPKNPAIARTLQSLDEVTGEP